MRLEGPLVLLDRMAFAGLPFVRLPGCGVLLHRRPASLSIPPLGSRVGALHPGACSPAGARPYLQMQAGLGDGGGPDPDAELLLWTRGEIKQKEVELSKLNERLRENEKKLDADGLAADKKRRLESDRIFMIKEGEYLVEALSDLRSVQKTITIAKTARLGVLPRRGYVVVFFLWQWWASSCSGTWCTLYCQSTHRAHLFCF